MKTRTIYQKSLLEKLFLLNEDLEKSNLIDKEVRTIGVNLIFLDFPLEQMDPLKKDPLINLPEEKLWISTCIALVLCFP